MPKAGDRVVVAGNKLGSPTRVGTLVKTVGSMIRVRWENGTESLFQPAAGSVRYETAGAKAASKPAKKAAPKAPAAKAPAKAKAAAPKKAAPKKAVAAAKPAAKKVAAKKPAVKAKPKR